MVGRMDRRKILINLVSAAVGAAVFLGFRGHAFRNPLDVAALARWQFRVATVAWVALTFYWEYAGRNAATAVRSETQSSRGLHVGLVSLAQLMVILPFRGVERIVPVYGWLMDVGVAVTLLGAGFAVWARNRLGRNWSGEITIKEEHRLIRTGPYKVVRHPIYTGLLAMYVGTAMVAGTWLAAAGVVLAMLAYWRKVRLEERNLEEAFGAEYKEYSEETWAILPGVF
jgi:protein-S-isoprenylcysteine O-methyltransferase Ste14